MDELYRSDNIVVRRVMATDVSRWVITFDNYGIGPGFDRLGFGEEFLRQSGVSAIHVLGRGDDWYQYPDMFEALASVRLAVADGQHILTYGSSMGGYAALRFADAVGATASLALSPQYSLNPSTTRGDRRWSHDAERIRWLPEIDGVLRCQCKPVIVYDPCSLDGLHGRQIAEAVSVTAIRLRHTAHPVTTHLAEIGLLSPLVFQALDGTLDAAAFDRAARERRNTSGTYLGELAMLQPLHRSRTALGLARRAVEAAPSSGHAIICLSRLLTREGQHEEAVGLLRGLVESSRFITHLIHYADALQAAGDHDQACRLANEVLCDTPGAAHLWGWAGYVFWTAGKPNEAREAVRTAIRLAPSNSYYRRLLTNYRFSAVDPKSPNGVRVPLWVRALRWIGNGRMAHSLHQPSSLSRPVSGT